MKIKKESLWTLEQDQMLASLYNSGIALSDITIQLNNRFKGSKRTKKGCETRVHQLHEKSREGGFAEDMKETKGAKGARSRLRIPEQALKEIYRQDKDQQVAKKVIANLNTGWTTEQDDLLEALHDEQKVSFKEIANYFHSKYPGSKRAWHHFRDRYNKLTRDRTNAMLASYEKQSADQPVLEKPQRTMQEKIKAVLGKKTMSFQEVAQELKKIDQKLKVKEPKGLSNELDAYISQVLAMGCQKNIFEQVDHDQGPRLYRVYVPKQFKVEEQIDPQNPSTFTFSVTGIEGAVQVVLTGALDNEEVEDKALAFLKSLGQTV